jgi:hypothetical protein
MVDAQKQAPLPAGSVQQEEDRSAESGGSSQPPPPAPLSLPPVEPPTEAIKRMRAGKAAESSDEDSDEESVLPGGNADLRAAFSVVETAATNEENELATIRVRTMYGLVEELRVAGGATDSLTRVLYLTNLQAQLFKGETVPLMLGAFEVATPSLVINLMGSFQYPSYYDRMLSKELTEQERADWHWAFEHTVQGSSAGSAGFASTDEATQACRRLSNFFKTVLLPLAAETNAVIVCQARNYCALSIALSECMPLFTARYGGKLPFTVLAITSSIWMEYNLLHNPDSLACELMNKSKNWRKGLPKFQRMAAKVYGDQPKEKWLKTDLQERLVNYIVIEGISGRNPDTERMDSGPEVIFQNELLQAMSTKLPTLCVSTGCSAIYEISPKVELASRDIPVLMLDPQPRPTPDVHVDPRDPSTRDELINKAIEANLEMHRDLWSKGKFQQYDQHELAYFYDVLKDDGNPSAVCGIVKRGSEKEETLYAALQHAGEVKTAGGLPYTHRQLEQVVDHIVEMMAQNRIRSLPASERAQLAPEFDATSADLIQGGFDPMEHYAEKMSAIWSVCFDVFSCERIYGANLCSLPGLQVLLDQIVKRDRLPPKNSLEAQQQLRSAWNAVDICTHNAVKYKRLAKVSYFLQLLLGVVVIVLTVFRENIDSAVAEDDSAVADNATDAGSFSSTGIFVTAALLTVLTGMSAFFSPAQRWRELRATAESLQSDIVQFRTRTGLFGVIMSEPRRPELRLMNRISDAKKRVVQLGGLGESSFTRNYPATVYQHGQNKGTRSSPFDLSQLGVDAPVHIEEGPVDNHHSPMKPSQYIKARLAPMLHYYRRRLPQKYREWKATVFLLLIVRPPNTHSTAYQLQLRSESTCAA